jgi:hypothetical protein
MEVSLMKQALRTHVAAALLLLPLGAAIVAQPAAAAPRAYVAQPDVRALALNSNGGLAPGATLRVQAYATPGAERAVVRLAGSGVQVPLREVTPGNYVGSHTLQRYERIDPSRMMAARFTWGDRTVAHNFSYPPAFQGMAMGAGRDRRDHEAPRISELTPSNGARVGERGRTAIHARFDDNASGVDARSVRLLVDGLDVTSEARIRNDELAYVERLGRGRHTAQLEVRDHAGNASRTAWSFRVL